MERCPSIADTIRSRLPSVQKIYYPLLAAFGVPANLITICILSRGKCSLSKCVTCYLVAMAVADLLVIILDLILRHIPIAYWLQFLFLLHVRLCNVHAVLLYAATDCSVWFTVTFTFDRFVAISCQKLKSKYCTANTAAVVLSTVTLLFFIKNMFWYFLYTSKYLLMNYPWFCLVTSNSLFSQTWVVIETLHYILTPGLPFVLILLLNILTVRHILVSNRARKRLRNQNGEDRSRDQEMESRRKSITLLLVISANFIILWAVLLIYSLWNRVWYLGYQSIRIHELIREIGFMLQLLSCCTNTCIYSVTQTKFRKQLKNIVKYPFKIMTKLIKK